MPRTSPHASKRTPLLPSQSEEVDPRWIAKAFALTVLAALICGYLSLCLLFYMGQWQLVLHPTRNPSSQSPVPDAPATVIHFGPDESATPQLTGWWIPAAPASRYAATTILYLRGADGSLADSSAALASLHHLGINVFAFDYRGYGQSAPTHPNAHNMAQDAEAAWLYLHTSRNLPEQQIVPYGIGIGASLATSLATNHPATTALILESPQGDLLAKALLDPRSHLVPARLLFHENFPLATPLATLATPKLLLSPDSSMPPAFQNAAMPRITVESAHLTAEEYSQTLERFLDQYLPAVPTSLPMTTPATTLTNTPTAATP